MHEGIIIALIIALSIAASDGGSSITCQPVQINGVQQLHQAQQCAWQTAESEFPLGGGLIAVWPSREVEGLVKQVYVARRIEAY